MNDFLKQWGEAAYTTTGFFWMALWAFILGYIISSMIQILVTEKRMQKMMGKNESKSVLLGTFFRIYKQFVQFCGSCECKIPFQERGKLCFFHSFFIGIHKFGH